MKIGKEHSVKEEEKNLKRNIEEKADTPKNKKRRTDEKAGEKFFLNGLGKGKRKIRSMKETIETKIINQ